MIARVIDPARLARWLYRPAVAIQVSLSPWPCIVAHTRAEGGPAGPVHIISSERVSYAEPVNLRCGSCRASVTAADDCSQTIVFTIGHQAGCPEVPDLLALAVS